MARVQEWCGIFLFKTSSTQFICCSIIGWAIKTMFILIQVVFILIQIGAISYIITVPVTLFERSVALVAFDQFRKVGLFAEDIILYFAITLRVNC